MLLPPGRLYSAAFALWKQEATPYYALIYGRFGSVEHGSGENGSTGRKPSGNDTAGRAGHAREDDYHIHLAAIVFTDIVGYSGMMEKDADRTIGILERHNALVLPLVAHHGGEVIDAIGDGLFLLFPSVRAAVECALATQRSIAEDNARTAEDDRFRLRIGVHIGEVRRKDGKAFGNGVNIAARIQPYAWPGGICISEDAARQISGPRKLELRSIGKPALKNISRRIALFQVITGYEVKGGNADSPENVEFDSIKQQILEEREKLARHREKRSSAPFDSLERRIEGTVYSFVERAMDTALRKWDEQPPEQKARMDAEFTHTKEPSGGDENIVVNIDPSDDPSEIRVQSKNGRGGSDIGFGALAITGFGFGYIYLGYGWMVWPLVLLGVLPLGSGLMKWRQHRAADRRARQHRAAELERALLQGADRLGGRLTVVQAASITHRPLDDVEKALEKMAQRGYVVQKVSESGVVEFEFPSLSTGKQ